MAAIFTRQQAELTEITALLTGPSIELHRPAPLVRRDLADTGREQLTLADARARMRSASAEVTGLVTAAEEAWNDVAGRLDAAAGDLPEVDPLGDQDLAGEISAVRAELDWLRGLLTAAAGAVNGYQQAVLVMGGQQR